MDQYQDKPEDQRPGIVHREPHDFAPTEGVTMSCWIDDGAGSMGYLIEPAIEHPGFYFLSCLSGAHFDYLLRPIRADFVEGWLKHHGLACPANALWREEPTAGVYKAGQSLGDALEAV